MSSEWQSSQGFWSRSRSRSTTGWWWPGDGAGSPGSAVAPRRAWERERYGLFDTSEPVTLAFSEELQAERAEDARRRGYTETYDLDLAARLAGEQYGLTARRVLALSPARVSITCATPVLRGSIPQFRR